MSTPQGKKNALLGGLLVFIIPVVAISIVYFTASRLPKPKELPLITPAEQIGHWQLINAQDTVTNSTYWTDVVLLFSVDSSNLNRRYQLLKTITEESLTHPEFSLKEPYGQIQFIVVTPQHFVPNKDESEWQFFQKNESFPFDLKDKLYLLDREGNIRGEYEFTAESINVLHIDIQYLLQRTYFDNKKNLRIKRLFKTSEEVKNETNEKK